MSEITNQTTEEKLFLAAEIVKEKGRWELMDVASSTNPRWFPGNGVISQLLQGVANKNYRIRRFQGAFPELPQGHSWHNPASILPVDLPEKYRLLTQTEAMNLNNIPGAILINLPIRGTDYTFYVTRRDAPITVCPAFYPYKSAS